MLKPLLASLKMIAILFTPVTIIGFEISRQEISGDQYAAALEVFGSETRPGAIEVFGVHIQTLSSLFDFFQSWSLNALVAVICLGIFGLALSGDRLKATWHFCLGLFVSFGIWAVFFTRSQRAFSEFIGSAVSDLSAQVIAKYLSDLSAKLLSLTGTLALLFGLLALILWALINRRKASSS